LLLPAAGIPVCRLGQATNDFLRDFRGAGPPCIPTPAGSGRAGVIDEFLLSSATQGRIPPSAFDTGRSLRTFGNLQALLQTAFGFNRPYIAY